MVIKTIPYIYTVFYTMIFQKNTVERSIIFMLCNSFKTSSLIEEIWILISIAFILMQSYHSIKFHVSWKKSVYTLKRMNMIKILY